MIATKQREDQHNACDRNAQRQWGLHIKPPQKPCQGSPKPSARQIEPHQKKPHAEPSDRPPIESATYVSQTTDKARGPRTPSTARQIRRASCRERVGQNGELPGVGG